MVTHMPQPLFGDNPPYHTLPCTLECLVWLQSCSEFDVALNRSHGCYAMLYAMNALEFAVAGSLDPFCYLSEPCLSYYTPQTIIASIAGHVAS